MRLLSITVLPVSFLLIAFVTEKAHSQSFFKNGYIVVTSGDTLRGELRERSAQAVDFRATLDSPVQAYTPTQLISYQAENGNHLAVSLTEEGQTTGYFMLEQIKGHVSLYSLFKAKGRLTHAIRLPDKTFIPLRGNLALLMLTQHLTECTNLSFTQLLNSQAFPLGNNQFERIVKAYNECVKPSQSIKKLKKPFHYEAGLSIGAVRNSWNYVGAAGINLPYWDPNGICSPHYTATFGSFFTIAPRKRLSLSIEFLFTNYKGSRFININNPAYPTSPDNRLYSFAESYLALPITGRYVFSNGSLRWYIKAGVVPTVTTALTGSILGTDIDADIIFRRAFGIGYLAGLGVDIRLGQKQHLYIEVRTMPHLVEDSIYHVADSRSLQLTVSMPLIER